MNEAPSSPEARAALVRSLVRAAQNDAPPPGSGARAMARLSAEGTLDAAARGAFGASRVALALSGAALAAAAAAVLAFSHGRLPTSSTPFSTPVLAPAERLDVPSSDAPRVALEIQTRGGGGGGGGGVGGGGGEGGGG